jgi:UDP-N-acetylglucosamine--N-acetylmuramyl-(pentapeptide) pyrophosphoryl-undecaprenol N-acetylglucosamine transferase
MIKKKKVLIATGGTGGHIFPAYSLAKYLIDQNFKVELTIDERGQRYLKDNKKIKLIKLPSSPLIKKNALKFLFSIIINIFSILKSVLLLLKNRPTIVIGMGGYSSFPVCIAASILRINFIIYENNLVIGKANKYLLPFTNKIFVSYRELKGIPKKYNDKIIEIGNLIREEIINTKILDYKNKLDYLSILVLGGSQAARVFAEELPQIFVRIKQSEIPIKIYQQCQKGQNDQLSSIYKAANIDHMIFNFSHNIINYYSKANLAITRSGASVLGELINLRIPFISIPLPTSADNHQYKNAEFYAKKGYGYLLEEKDIKYKLYDLINSTFKDKSLINNFLQNQIKYSDKNVFKNINNEIIKMLNEKN